MDSPRLNAATATEYEIVAAARQMHDRTLGELADSRWTRRPSSRVNKGGAGAIVERYFGISQNSDQEPDFRGAGIELKVAPLVMAGRTAARIKERTSITMIDYMALDRETWASASLRKKLRRILFVFYAWRPSVPLGKMRVVTTRIWSPPDDLLPHLERDWLAVWTKNNQGRAHEISEGDGVVLGACTKGASGAKRRQPHSAICAKSRAWSLKPRLTWSIYSGSALEDFALQAGRTRKASRRRDPVDELLRRAEDLVGLTIRQVASRFRLEPGLGKDRVASVMRRALGLRPRRLPSSLEALGLELKTVPLGPSAEPHEAMSFSAFDPRELAGEAWEDSDLCARLQNLLLVPIYRQVRKSDLLEQRVCRPFRWAPDREQLRGIRGEWERYRGLMASGKAKRLPPESDTRFIHVRPHGRNAADVVEAPGAVRVVRSCFWLNREFIRELVLTHSREWKGF
jgi:DNA mismatch repair endonuclease MutH